MLQFEWSPLIILFSSRPVSVPILCWLYQEHQIQLVSPSLKYSTVFDSLARSTYWSFFLFWGVLFFSFTLGSAGTVKLTIRQVLFIIITNIILFIRVFFHISVSWWFSTGVWVTATLFKSVRIFLVFWPISTMLLLGCLHLCSYFQVLRSLYQFIGDYTERANYYWYHRYFHVP